MLHNHLARSWPVVLLLACTGTTDRSPPPFEARWSVTIQGVTREYSYRGEPSLQRAISRGVDNCTPTELDVSDFREGSHGFSIYFGASSDGRLHPSFAQWSLPPGLCPPEGRCRFVASHIRECVFRTATLARPGTRITLELAGTCRLYRLSGGAPDQFVDGDYIDLQQFRYQTELQEFHLHLGDGGLATPDCGTF